MNYTKKERAAIAKVFKEAKRILSLKHRPTNFICHAVDAATESAVARKHAASIIRDRLDDEYTLSDWLSIQGVPISQLTGARLNKHRRDWLTLLIKEFSK